MVDANGVESYGAKLCNTVCVEYYEDGSVVLRSGGWATPSTARFIHKYSPFTCFKTKNQLWVRAGEDKLYPIGNELRMVQSEQGYVPDKPIKINTQRIDRQKAKAAREPLQPFLNFARSFLSLSDGWVMHETCKQVLGWKGDSPEAYQYATSFSHMNEPEMYRRVIGNPSEENYLYMLCAMSRTRWLRGMGVSKAENLRLAESFKYEVEYNGHKWPQDKNFYDVKIHFDDVKHIVYKWIEKNEDVHKIVEVDPSGRAISNVVNT